MTDESRNGLIRTEWLLGKEAMRRLADSRVAVFGVGGVGGYVVEALARSGVGALDICDKDRVDITNLNRQIIALHSTVGRMKVEVAAERIRDIAPECRVVKHPVFYLPDTADRFDFTEYDYVVDAVDTVTAKLSLIQRAKEAGVPIISSMGAGNKLDPASFRVADIYDTTVCPLAKVMRRECRKRGIRQLKCVYSTEEAMVPGSRGGREESPAGDVGAPEGESSAEAAAVPRRSSPGSVAFVPSVAGLILAGEVIKDLVKLPARS